ncbi:MAG: DUF2079 domain-containing protein [Candidatus Micrarchaeota archaeon]|nr:DUF2079 domain-containing protein [Candidatus Micrarchaeota archaeon]
MRQSKSPSVNRYLLILVILSTAYFGYWIMLAHYKYVNYQSSFFDIGGWVYVMYQHVHGITMGPMQYLVFFAHLSPIMLAMVPIFAIYPHAITLTVAQDVLLALTAALAYFVALDIFKSRKIGFAFGLAMLINSGIRGLAYYDFHPEAFIPFFYILSFYFYYKCRKRYFILSYVLLLSVMETAYVVGITLLVGLLMFELLYNARKDGIDNANYRKRLGLILIGIALTVVVAILYRGAAVYITQTYATTSTYAVPPVTRLINYITIQVKTLANPSVVSYKAGPIYGLGGIDLSEIFLGFGITSLSNPIMSLVLYSPWLFEVFILHNWTFLIFSAQYFGYVVGASYVSAILGYLILDKYKGRISHALRMNARSMEILVPASIVILSFMFSLLFLSEVYTPLVFQSYPGVNYTQINGALSMIPNNSSVMTQTTIAPHLAYMRNLEFAPTLNVSGPIPTKVTVYWFVPEYIVIDKNLPTYYSEFSSNAFNVYSYMGDNYTALYNGSGLYIYRRIGSSGT